MVRISNELAFGFRTFGIQSFTVNKSFARKALTSGGFMLSTFVILPCMMRKWGLLTFSWTERKKSITRLFWIFDPLIRYLFLPPTTTCWQENTFDGVFKSNRWYSQHPKSGFRTPRCRQDCRRSGFRTTTICLNSECYNLTLASLDRFRDKKYFLICK